jgi:hypothetical protein
MNSSKTIFLFAIVALIMLFVFPIQSIAINENSEKLPMRHKRWTFNTWRLHGRRQLANGLIVYLRFRNVCLFLLDLYSSKSLPSDEDHPYEMFSNENDMARTIHTRLTEFFRKYNRQ